MIFNPDTPADLDDVLISLTGREVLTMVLKEDLGFVMKAHRALSNEAESVHVEIKLNFVVKPEAVLILANEMGLLPPALKQ